MTECSLLFQKANMSAASSAGGEGEGGEGGGGTLSLMAATNPQHLHLFTHLIDNMTTTSEATTDASPAAFASDTVSGSVVVAFEMYVSPLIALVGLVSNVVSVCVLARLERGSVAGGSSKMAQSAHIGLMSLALADFLYCLCVVPELFVKSRGPIFKDRGFDLFYLMYGHCWQNVFLFTSTWLTVTIAIGRYTAICYPLQARYLISRTTTSFSAALAFIISLLVQLPQFWTYSPEEFRCVEKDEMTGVSINVTYIYVDHGYFVTTQLLKKTFTYVWFVIGFVVPVICLTFCNAHLIRALRESGRIQRLYRANNHLIPSAASGSGSGGGGGGGKGRGSGSHPAPDMTTTLIAVITSFIVLVTPSEVVHFLYYAVVDDTWQSFSVVMVMANALQTVSFAVNFVLYFVLNRQFRRALSEARYCCGYWRRWHTDMNEVTQMQQVTHVTSFSPQRENHENQRLLLFATRSTSLIACETVL